MQYTMRMGITGLACSVALGLASCGGDDNGGGSPPISGGMTNRGFEPYLQQVVKQSSCENNLPVITDNVTFQFAADQDTAEPRDLSTLTPGCT